VVVLARRCFADVLAGFAQLLGFSHSGISRRRWSASSGSVLRKAAASSLPTLINAGAVDLLVMLVENFLKIVLLTQS
jgi:hypothetical protein